MKLKVEGVVENMKQRHWTLVHPKNTGWAVE